MIDHGRCYFFNFFSVKKRHDSLIDAAFSDADEYIVNFIKILCEKKCVHLFSDCVKHFEKLYNKANNIEKITVITAVPLSDSLKEKLVKKLGAEYNKKILPEYKKNTENLTLK